MGAFVASLFGHLVPLFGRTFGAMFLGEPFSRPKGVGMALVLVGLWMLYRTPVKRRTMTSRSPRAMRRGRREST